MRKSITFTVLSTCVLAISAMSLISAEESRSENKGLTSSKPGVSESSEQAQGEFVVHEWGTFTTFSGSDGLFLDFRPLANEASDLPSFVLDRANGNSLHRLKRNLRGRVRMETPVTYFYTDRIRQIDVSVDFPKGLLTEFYPPVREMLPKFDPKVAYKEGEPLGNSRLNWGKVTLLPIKSLAPKVDDEKLGLEIAHHIAHSAVPRAINDNHYIQARATDSALVYMNPSGDAGVPPWIAPQGHLEKFLFYRGVGDFQLPFQTHFDDDGKIVVSNNGHLPMNSAILVHVEGDKIMTASIDQIDAGKSKTFGSPKHVSANDLAKIVRAALEREGLYDKEASSMVATWRQSWFTEEGTRVLYMVPQPMTDELLPLHVSPAPNATLRVLVGRMEIMSPDKEEQLLKAVAASKRTRAQYIKQAEKSQKKQQAYKIPDSISQMGRLAEPALVRVAKISSDASLRTEAELLIQQLRKQ